MFKYTKYLLQKLEGLFADLDYTIRYERGTFQSGYCVVEQQKIVVINRFLDTEARINCLLEILDSIDVDEQDLSEESVKTLKKVMPVLSAKQSAES